MPPELRHLRYLQAVADHGNFTRAAHDLHVSQPTLSQQIQQLERGVGARLLDRSGRTVRLTDALHRVPASVRAIVLQGTSPLACESLVATRPVARLLEKNVPE